MYEILASFQKTTTCLEMPAVSINRHRDVQVTWQALPTVHSVSCVTHPVGFVPATCPQGPVSHPGHSSTL